MKTRSKSNNLIALLIALILMAIGFTLGFIHRQSESKEEKAGTPVTTIMTAFSEKDTLS
jgi:predicted negative regulator of RcsB-dependent stress response